MSSRIFMTMSGIDTLHDPVSPRGRRDLKIIVSGFEATTSSPGHCLAGKYGEPSDYEAKNGSDFWNPLVFTSC